MSTKKKGREITRAPQSVLKFYDRLCADLERAASVDEVKKIKNEADRMKLYARQAKNKKLEADAAEVRMRAIAMIGVMMDKQSQTVGLAKPGEHGGRKRKFDGLRQNPSSQHATLKEAGIDKNLAHQARKLGKAFIEGKLGSLITDERERIMRGGIERRAIRTIDLTEARAERARRYEKGSTVADLESLIAQGKRFGVIYLDIPWRYDTDGDSGRDRSPDKHYPTMSFEQLKAFMPLITKLAADNCALFPWVPGTHALEAQELLTIAGFKFKKNNAFTWVKLLHPDTAGLSPRHRLPPQ
jgi:hypothetical protein